VYQAEGIEQLDKDSFVLMSSYEMTDGDMGCGVVDDRRCCMSTSGTLCARVCVCVFVWASARPMQPGVSSDNMILAFKLFARPRSIPPPFGELPKQLGFNNFRIYRPLIICDHNY
jgi:hypothetical protein